MSWAMAGAAAITVAGGAINANSAKKAAGQQSAAADKAIASTDRQFNLSRADMAPYQNTGEASLNVLRRKMGIYDPSISVDKNDPRFGEIMNQLKSQADEAHKARFGMSLFDPRSDYNTPNGKADQERAWDEMARQAYVQHYGDEQKQNVTGAGDFGELTRKFTTEDMNADPVMKASFDFGLSEGEKAVKRMFGARGLSRSGAAVKAASRFATDYTGTKAGESEARFVQDQNNTFNKLAGVAGTGQAATTTMAGVGANTAGTNAGILTAEGNARGAASIAQGNAYSGALNNVGNQAMGQYTLGRILNSGRQPFTMDTPQVQPQVSGQFNLDNYG